MKLKLSNTVNNSFQVAIGDDGIVVVYSQKGYAKNKLFIKSTEPADVERLVKLLNSDPEAEIYLYIDTLDQNYAQKTIPAVGKLASNSLAQKRLERELPKDSFKSFVQIGRSPAGRKDWIYTFISAEYEHPISTWIEFFTPFRNIINGIYFMPIELYSVVRKIRQVALDENKYNDIRAKATILDKIKSYFTADQINEDSRWELYLSQNKTGGFRQVAYQDGKIIFSRLINNINAPSAEIVAGNIEHEITNSIEYMMRLSLGGEKAVDVYMVVAEEIVKHIRRDKIKCSHLFIYTPYQLSKKLVVPESAAETDKFVDPTILTYFARVKKKYIRLFTPEIKQIYFAAKAVKVVANIALIMAPVMLITSTYFVDAIIGLRASIKQIQSQARNFSVQISEQEKKITRAASDVEKSLDIGHVKEIVKVHEFLEYNQISPIDFIEVMAEDIPKYAVIKNIKWSYYDPALIKVSNNKKIFLNGDNSKRTHRLMLEFEMVLKTGGNSFEDLELKYAKVRNLIKGLYQNFEVSVSELPQTFTFQDISNPIAINVRISSPLSDKKQRNLPQIKELLMKSDEDR